jgi:hypothetical protein
METTTAEKTETQVARGRRTDKDKACELGCWYLRTVRRIIALSKKQPETMWEKPDVASFGFGSPDMPFARTPRIIRMAKSSAWGWMGDKEWDANITLCSKSVDSLNK